MKKVLLILFILMSNTCFAFIPVRNNPPIITYEPTEYITIHVPCPEERKIICDGNKRIIFVSERFKNYNDFELCEIVKESDKEIQEFINKMNRKDRIFFFSLISVVLLIGFICYCDIRGSKQK